MERFIEVATIAVSGSTSSEARAAAEREMSFIIEQPDALGYFLGVLREVDETVLFFVLVGIQRIIWKRWGYLSENERNSLGGVLIGMIIERSHALQKFSRSKLEQVLANVCVQSGSLDHVVQVLNQSDTGSYQNIAKLNNVEEILEKLRKTITGLSSLRTVLDEALNMKDPRLSPNQQKAVSEAANQMVVPAMDLACTVLNTSLSATTDIANSTAGAIQGMQAQALSTHFYASKVALETIRVIMVRIPMGDHVSVLVLELLFAVSKLGIRGSGSFNGLVSTSDIEGVSQLAIECLHELMLKRYIPNNKGQDGHVRGSSSDTLMYLATNTRALFEEYLSSQASGGGGSGLEEDSSMLAPLLDFLSSFSATHLERCLQQGPVGQDFVVSLLNTLISIGTSLSAAGSPEILVKLAGVWADLLDMDEVRAYALTHGQLADPLAALACQLFSSCLLSKNSTLRLEYAVELMDASADPEPFVDPHIRELLHDSFLVDTGAAVAGGDGVRGHGQDAGAGAGIVEGREEESSSAGALRKQVLQVLNILANCDRVREQLGVLSMRSWDEINAGLGISADGQTRTPATNISGLASDISLPSLLSLDLAFVAKTLPLHLPPSALLLRLASFLASLNASRFFSQGAAQTSLWVELCQILSQLCTSFSNTCTPQEVAYMLTTLLPVLSGPLHGACDASITPAPRVVTNATLVLAITVMTAARATFEKCNTSASGIGSANSQGVGAGLGEAEAPLLASREAFAEGTWIILQNASASGTLTLENYALLCTLVDEVAPFRASQAATAALVECTGTLGSVASSLMQQQPPGQPLSSAHFYRMLATSAKLSTLSRLLCGLSASVRHQSMVRAHKKKMLGDTVEAVFPAIVSLSRALFTCLSHSLSSLQGRTEGAGAVVGVVTRVLGLTGALLQSLGAKTAMDGALAVGEQSITYALQEMHSQGQGQVPPLLYDGSTHGTALAKAMLQLVQVVAKSSSSSTTATKSPSLAGQALSLLQVLAASMSSGLPGSRRVVAEILKCMLDTGSVLVTCYWKRHKPGLVALQAFAGERENKKAVNSNVDSPVEPTGGEHCKQIVILVCGLSSASLTTPEVPPDDAITSIEGMATMMQDQYLLGVPWFVAQDDAWGCLLEAVVRCILCRYHVVHTTSLEELFVLLVSDIDIPKLEEEAQRQVSVLPPESLRRLEGLCAKDDVPGQTSGIVQSVLDITARVASERGGAAVSQALIGFHAQFQEERERLRQATLGPGQGQFESSFGVRAVPGAVKGRRSKEAKLLLATVLHPVAAECAKVEDSLQDRQA